MPDYFTTHIRLPNGRVQDVTVVLHSDIGDRDDGSKLDSFVPTRNPISLHLGGGSRSWRGGRVEEMDDAGHPITEGVTVTDTKYMIAAARYGQSCDSNIRNMLVKLVVPTLPTEKPTDTRDSSGGRPLSSRWPLALLPHDWRQHCIQHLTSVLSRIVKLGIRAALAIIALLLFCQVLVSSIRHYHYHQHHYVSHYSSSTGGSGKGSNGSENQPGAPVPVMLLPLELPRQLTDAVYLHGGLVVANTNWLVNETASAVADVVARCGCNRPPKRHQHKKLYPSPLCESLCSNAGQEASSPFPGPGPLLVLEKSLFSFGGSSNYWLEDISPRWLDMAQAQDGEMQRTYTYLDDTDIDTDSFSETLNSNLNSISSTEADYQYPHTITPLISSSSMSSYLTTLESTRAREISLSVLELQSRLHGRLLRLGRLRNNALAWITSHAEARTIFETKFVPRNDRLRNAFDRTMTGFIADVKLVDVMWKGAFATFVTWDDWLEEPAKALTAVRKAAVDFNQDATGSGDGEAGWKGKTSREKADLQLALHVQTMCSEALGRVRDARNAASALAQHMDNLQKLAKTYSASGWRVRKRVMDLERDGMVSVQSILDLLERDHDVGSEPLGRREDHSDYAKDQDAQSNRRTHLMEQVIEAWVVWPVGEDVREEIEKAATLMSPRK